MMQYTNAFSFNLLNVGAGYPLVVGGKPPGAFPSMVPIIFELGILLCGFATLFGLLHIIKLPMHNHPIFESDRFEAASDDKYFISIEAGDQKFDLDRTKALLEATNPTYLELDRGGGAVMRALLITLAFVTLAPDASGGESGEPPVVGIRNMYNQPRYDTQERQPFFADQRSMRPQVEGTVSREMEQDLS